jgi:integrase
MVCSRGSVGCGPPVPRPPVVEIEVAAPALDAAGIARRGPYCLRHTFATEALAAGVSIFELARLMGTSVKVIDRTYGHLARDSEDAIRARLNARSGQSALSGVTP